MITVKHRFLNHQIDPRTETLIIGTFNPETADNGADFFYGRKRNFLWRLLPVAFGEESLREASKQEKLSFIKKHKIDFVDLIREVEVEKGQEANYYDGYLDHRVREWNNVIALIDNLTDLKRVCFTRKTFSDIPNMKKQIEVIQQHCLNKKVIFKALKTPARFYGQDKQTEWTNFLLDDSQ